MGVPQVPVGPEQRPAEAAEIFGAHLALAERYAHSLVSVALPWGLLGPAEAERIWSRHLLNSASLRELVPCGAAVVDVGSGAGLPGIPLALARPDLTVTLLEPLERRVRYLDSVVAELGVPRLAVLRSRAEAASGRYDVVTARAVAPVGRLVRNTRHLLGPSGMLLVLKGARAADEVRDAGRELKRYALTADILTTTTPPTTVVRISRREASGD